MFRGPCQFLPVLPVALPRKIFTKRVENTFQNSTLHNRSHYIVYSRPPVVLITLLNSRFWNARAFLRFMGRIIPLCKLQVFTKPKFGSAFQSMMSWFTDCSLPTTNSHIYKKNLNNANIISFDTIKHLTDILSLEQVGAELGQAQIEARVEFNFFLIDMFIQKSRLRN